MWSRSAENKIMWSDAAKMLLVGLVKKYPASLIEVRGGYRKKNAAWDLIINELLDYGMPSAAVEKVRVNWSKYKTKALEANKRKKRSKNAPSLSKFHLAVIDALDSSSKKDVKHLMPKPIVTRSIKTEPMDEEEGEEGEDEEVKNGTTAGNDADTEETMNKSETLNTSNTQRPDPVVKLSRISTNDHSVASDHQLKAVVSAKYIKLMEEVAEHELKLKLSKRENEEERMEFEREMHRKNLFLMDLKIRVEQEKLEALSQARNYK